MKEAILNVENLSKVYSSTKAVDGVSFTVERGEIVGLLGPNGAGKTTTTSMILGVLEPTSGTISVLGRDINEKRLEVMQDINFAAVYGHLPGNLSVYQNLRVFSLLYNIPDRKGRVDELIKEFDLEPFRKTNCGLLSSGEQTRVGLAKAFLNSPKLLLLDEPTASLDPHTAILIREKIKRYVSETGAGVLWTSHNMHEVEAVCSKVLFLSKGKILLSGDPRTLPGEHGKKNLEELFITVAQEPLSLEIYE